MQFTDDEIATLGMGLARLIDNYLENAAEAEPEGDHGFMASTIHLPGKRLAIFVMGPELAGFLTRLTLVMPFCEEFFEEVAANASAHRGAHAGKCRRRTDPKRKHEVN